ncbi:hypothetical protein N658DRAFT_421512 [Parathielavia hyrcaniae]|uniref:Transmembrane protein 42 n=1 Tax=Parathielavia hyrcaniae TaxID=113614 RepID=A0AAN6Q859_9PEZI|nr:hypothetical protein N658DRAFT_421512 [Parathielavia hyrcaniae]
MSPSDEDQQPLLDLSATATEDGVEALSSVESRGGWAQRNQWIVLALASGACAAFNGAFAKLTTTELTTSFSLGIARLMGLESLERVIEVAVRCTFFGLNLAFNGVMWTLFTKALARGDSTTQVSIINTSANFIITALLGYAIFSEALPPLWWLGAGMLVAGNVIVGRKDEGLPKEEVQGEGESEVVIAGDDDTLISGRRLEDSPGQVSGRRAHPSLGKDEDEDVADLRM